MATTVTSKGQVTVPKNIRDYLGLRAGSKVGFVLGARGEVIVEPVDTDEVTHGSVRAFASLVGTLDAGGESTDALMRLLRGYGADDSDPGFR